MGGLKMQQSVLNTKAA